MDTAKPGALKIAIWHGSQPTFQSGGQGRVERIYLKSVRSTKGWKFGSMWRIHSPRKYVKDEKMHMFLVIFEICPHIMKICISSTILREDLANMKLPKLFWKILQFFLPASMYSRICQHFLLTFSAYFSYLGAVHKLCNHLWGWPKYGRLRGGGGWSALLPTLLRAYVTTLGQ